MQEKHAEIVRQAMMAGSLPEKLMHPLRNIEVGAASMPSPGPCGADPHTRVAGGLPCRCENVDCAKDLAQFERLFPQRRCSPLLWNSHPWP